MKERVKEPAFDEAGEVEPQEAVQFTDGSPLRRPNGHDTCPGDDLQVVACQVCLSRHHGPGWDERRAGRWSAASRAGKIAAMSDDELRALERRFLETGALEDEANWLRAQLAAGRVSENALRLRAYDEDAAARLALGDWKDDNKWLGALREQRGREKAERLAKARKAAAERGKEPFDLEALAKIYAFSGPYEAEHYRRYAGEYEHEYYVTWPNVMTIAEFARLKTRLDAWD